MGSGHIRFGHGVAHQLRDLGVTRVASLLPASTKECPEPAAGGSPVPFLLPEKPQPAPEPPRLGVTLERGEKGRPHQREVSAGSLAEKSGLLAGDRIVEMAGRPVTEQMPRCSPQFGNQPLSTWLPLKVARRMRS